MNLQDLSALALSRMPQPVFSGATPLEKMLDGFEQTRKVFLPLVPKGAVLDFNAAAEIMQRLQSEFDHKADYLQLQLQTGKDLAEALAITLGPNQSRQFFIAQYVMAVQGIGAYVSGAALAEVKRGALKQADFDAGIDMRTRVFATLVSAGQSGALAVLLQGETVANRVIKTQGMPSSSVTTLVVSSQGTGVRAAAVPLGALPVIPAVPPVVAAIIVIVAIAIVAAVAYSVLKWYDLKRNADLMEDICQRAVREGNPHAAEICKKYIDKAGAKSLLSDILGEAGTKAIGKWLVIGVLVAAGIYFLPAIAGSFKKTGKALKE